MDSFVVKHCVYDKAKTCIVTVMIGRPEKQMQVVMDHADVSQAVTVSSQASVVAILFSFSRILYDISKWFTGLDCRVPRLESRQSFMSFVVVRVCSSRLFKSKKERKKKTRTSTLSGIRTKSIRHSFSLSLIK